MITSVITSRRSIFPEQYNDTPMTVEEVKTLLEMAHWAPTHKRTEPWRFKVFHSLEAREQLARFFEETYPKSVTVLSETKLRKMVEKPLRSGCVIAICFQREEQESLPEWEEIAATAMAVQNMWLQATEMGLGAYWSTPGLLKYFGDYFPLNKGERCLGFFHVGHYKGESMEGRRNSSVEAKTTWI